MIDQALVIFGRIDVLEQAAVVPFHPVHREAGEECPPPSFTRQLRQGGECPPVEQCWVRPLPVHQGGEDRFQTEAVQLYQCGNDLEIDIGLVCQ